MRKKGTKNKTLKGTFKYCEICNNGRYIYPSHLNRNNRFCSRECKETFYRGKKYEEVFDIEKSNRIKGKISNSNIGKERSSSFKIKRSQYMKIHNPMKDKNIVKKAFENRNLSKIAKKTVETKRKNGFFKKWSKVMKNGGGAKARKACGGSITKIEKAMDKALMEKGLKYEKEKIIFNHAVDFFIEPNIIIECDGVYWHSLEKQMMKDFSQTLKYSKEGYNVYRFFEDEINKDINGCLNRVDFNNYTGGLNS